MFNMVDSLYPELIIDLYKHPLNNKKLADFDLHRIEKNASCGDLIELYVKFDENNKVTDVGFAGDGCALSQAGASILTEQIKGLTKTELEKITKDDVLGWLGLTNINPSRLRCVLLSLETLRKALN